MGTFGFIFNLTGLLPFRFDSLWVELTDLLAILCGAFMLRGQNWARWLALAWMAFHVVVSAFNSFRELAIHVLFFAVIAWLLLRPNAARYFRGFPMERGWGMDEEA